VRVCLCVFEDVCRGTCMCVLLLLLLLLLLLVVCVCVCVCLCVCTRKARMGVGAYECVGGCDVMCGFVCV
jgi:hypothetical protein